ncbi:MAG: DUF4349 domain-containing protein [Bacteroidota bacterium]|nr:DUF4349 domain-containing protein [Bacteroidota bacterium]
MKTLILNLALILVMMLFSCKQKSNELDSDSINVANIDIAPPSASMEYSADLNAPPPPVKEMVKFAPPEVKDDAVETNDLTSNSPTKKSVAKKIIKDGNISVKAKDIAASKKGIDETVKKLNAYYEVEDLQNNDQSTSYDLKIRVPSINFEKLIAAIEGGKDEITSKSIQARDVTEEFMDIETRLSNKREYLKRYKELLAKALKVDDILAIEENIRVLQEEIESSEGRLKYLGDQVAYSTLNLNIYKEKAFVYKAPEEDKFSERVKKSLGNGWSSVVNFVLWLITIWPFIIVMLVLFFAVRRFIKKWRSKKK